VADVTVPSGVGEVYAEPVYYRFRMVVGSTNREQYLEEFVSTLESVAFVPDYLTGSVELSTTAVDEDIGGSDGVLVVHPDDWSVITVNGAVMVNGTVATATGQMPVEIFLGPSATEIPENAEPVVFHQFPGVNGFYWRESPSEDVVDESWAFDALISDTETTEPWIIVASMPQIAAYSEEYWRAEQTIWSVVRGTSVLMRPPTPAPSPTGYQLPTSAPPQPPSTPTP
jgi:hypothetical protein